MNLFKAFIAKQFLGTESSRENPLYFDNCHRFLNTKLVSENGEKYFGYISLPSTLQDYDGCFVLLHGIYDNRKDFLQNYNFYENMRSNYLYVIPEYPGFGESDIPYSKISCYNMLKMWFNKIIEDYKINSFIIVGQSFGATLAIDFYDYLWRNGLLLKDLNYLTSQNNLMIQNLPPSEKYFIKKMFLYSPFAKTNSVICENIHLSWGKSVFENLISGILDNEIKYDLTTISKDLDSSNMTIIYSMADNLVSASNAELLKRILNASFVKSDYLSHTELFHDNSIWTANYAELERCI